MTRSSFMITYKVMSFKYFLVLKSALLWLFIKKGHTYLYFLIKVKKCSKTEGEVEAKFSNRKINLFNFLRS